VARSVLGRVVLILAVLAGSVAAYIASGVNRVRHDVTGTSKPVLADYLKNGIKLGLDLKGGIHLVLQVKTADALKIETDDAVEQLVAAAKDQANEIGPIDRTGPGSFAVGITANTDQDKLADLLKNNATLRDWTFSREGPKWIFSMRPPARSQIEEQAVQQAVETIRNRVDQFGVAEPVIQREGADRVIVQLPGIDDPKRVKDIIKNTAFLELKKVEAGPGDKTSLLASYGGQVPADMELVEAGGVDDVAAGGKGTQYYLVDRVAVVTGRDLRNARPSTDEFGQPAVSFSLNAAGAEKFGKATGAMAPTHQRLAIILDNKVQSAPQVNSQITDSGIIQGHFTQERANDLALVLRAGALPAGLTYLEERTVGPSLGLDSIRKGVTSAILGALFVFVAMIVYYRRAGLNAVLALILNAIILLGAMAQLEATLTLPGIAGFILTIGMAVDSNVLIFERIREELRLGKTPKTAIENGFSKAFMTIIDTHVTTIVSALFLFQFGTGPVKGFAVTLIIGLLASVFTAVYVSHTIFMLEYERRERVEYVSI
jgi:preprotein translocase subunit SecD